MQAVRSKNTKPEMAIREIIKKLGYRFKFNITDLPGKPDIVHRRRKKVIFIHGCFWHLHNCKAGRNLPNTNKEYWIPKLLRNRDRDKRNIELLKKAGWDVFVIWECQIKKDSLPIRLKSFIDMTLK